MKHTTALFQKSPLHLLVATLMLLITIQGALAAEYYDHSTDSASFVNGTSKIYGAGTGFDLVNTSHVYGDVDAAVYNFVGYFPLSTSADTSTVNLTFMAVINHEGDRWNSYRLVDDASGGDDDGYELKLDFQNNDVEIKKCTNGSCAAGSTPSGETFTAGTTYNVTWVVGPAGHEVYKDGSSVHTWTNTDYQSFGWGEYFTQCYDNPASGSCYYEDTLIQDNATSSPPVGPNASAHKVETVTKQAQTTNVTLNSVAYTTIFSYSFTPANATQFYQYFTVPVDPTTSNTLTCKIQVDGADLGGEYSRTNTAGEIGQLLIKSSNTSLTAASHDLDLLCKRTGGGSMVLYDIVGSGHLLFDAASGDTIPYTIGNFSATSTTGGAYTILNNNSMTTANSNLTDMEHHVVLEYTATITNNGGSTETVYLQPEYGSYNCSTTVRTLTSGGSGSVGGTCAIKNVSGNTAYTYAFYGNGTNVDYDLTYDFKEFYLEDADINTTQIDWNKAAETGWNEITDVTVQQDLGANQDIYSSIGISHEGSGGLASYEIRLSGSSTNSSTFQRQATTSWGVLGAHNVFEDLATANYTTEFWAEVTNIDEIVGQLVSYEAGKQSATVNQFLFNATDAYWGTAVNNFTVTLESGLSFGTTTGDIYIAKQGLQNITYSDGSYQNIQYLNVNTSATSHTGNMCQVYVNGSQATDVEGNNIAYPYNLSINGTTTAITSAASQGCAAIDQTIEHRYSKNGWIPLSTNVQYDNSQTTSYTPTNIHNYNMTFIGATSGNSYNNALCQVNGSYFTRYNTQYFAFTNDTTILACDEDTNYPAFNQTLDTSNPPGNITVNVTEYSLSLTFYDENNASTSTLGNVTWIHDTDETSRGQYPVNESGAAAFSFIRIKAEWAENTLVKVTFNELTAPVNSSAQYYHFRNDLDVAISEDVMVLSQLDGTAWVNVQNYGQEELIESTVKVEYCPNENSTDCRVVSQILTEPRSGLASPGTPIYLDTEKDYWVTVSKSGYQTQADLIRGQDLVDGEELLYKLKPIITANTKDYHILLDNYHSNETSLFVITSYALGGTYFYNTTYNPSLTSTSFLNGGDWFTLTLGTDYAANTDFTLHLWTYDSTTGTYTQVKTHDVTYQAIDNRSILDRIADNSTLRTILWIMLIILASILGSYITRDGIDTGYYIFAGGSFLLAFISSTFIPIAAVFGIIGIGSLIFSVTRE